jgi:hypothetical protein
LVEGGNPTMGDSASGDVSFTMITNPHSTKVSESFAMKKDVSCPSQEMGGDKIPNGGLNF